MQLPDVNAVEEYIRDAAERRGIDPEIAVAVAKSEGLAKGTWQSNYSRNGFREPSFGPFQLLDGGPKTGFPKGLGNSFRAKTGLNPAETKNVYAGIDYALDHAAKNGWGAWYGAAKVGVGRWDGIGPNAKAVGVYGQNPTHASPALQEFVNYNEARQGKTGIPGFPVDTSLAALGSMASMPGIDGLPSKELSREGIPSGRPGSISPAMAEFSGFNEARDLSQATGIGAAFQGDKGPTRSDFSVADPFSSGMATPSVAVAPAKSSVVDAYTEYANSRPAPASTAVANVPSSRFDQAFSAFDKGVPTSRIDQAFAAFDAPAQTTTTHRGLPALDAPQTVEARSAPVGYVAPEALTATPGTAPTTTGKPGMAGVFDKGRVNGALAGSVIAGPVGAAVGYALGPAIGRAGQSKGVFSKGQNTASKGIGLGRAVGGLVAGPLGALAAPSIGRGLSNIAAGFGGSPSVGHAALGYAMDRAMANPNYTGLDFSRDFTNMGGMISNGRPAPGQVTAAEFNAAQRGAGKAIGVMEGLSRDFSEAFGKDKDKDSGGKGESKGGCFLTTAAVDVTGEADNGDTLETLRWFRDNIMRARPDWSADVEEYYRIAPAIVERLDGDKATYERLMKEHIRPAVSAIKAGEYETAYRVYRAMVDDLQEAEAA